MKTKKLKELELKRSPEKKERNEERGIYSAYFSL